MFSLKFLCGVSAFILWSGAAYADNVSLYPADKLNFQTKNGGEFVYGVDGNPFEGAVILPDSAGHETTYLYKHGQKNGVATTYAEDKRILSETAYSDGMKNGAEVGFYPNGEPQYQRIYKNNILNGAEILFNENGKPQKQSHYENGILNGAVNYFDDNGELIKSETYKNGVKDGAERVIQNNSLMAEDNFVAGRLNGTSKKYNTQYLTDEIEYIDGLREGWHKHYEEDGTVVEIPYHNDMRNGAASIYWPNKAVAQITVYADGRKNGFEQKFRPDGSRISIANYSNDKPEGIARYFDETGNLSEIKYYKNGEQTAAINLNNADKTAQIYQSYKEGKLGTLLKQRNLWYRILWLGLNTEKADIVEGLEKAMNMYAFAIDDMEVYKRFSGADFEAQTQDLYFGLTPFMYAATVAAPTTLLQKFAAQSQAVNSDGETPLQYCVRQNNAKNFDTILNILPATDGKTMTDLLFYALQNNIQSKIVMSLISGADVSAKDDSGNTALDYAVKNSASPEVITALLNAGADIGQPQYHIVLTEALRQNLPSEYIKLLLSKKVEPVALDAEGKSALYYAKSNHYPAEITDLLVQNGAVWSNADKQSLIKDAVAENSIAALQNFNLPTDVWDNITDEGQSALQYAYALAAPDSVLQYLAENGTDIDHRDSNGKTVLHNALDKNDKVAVLKFLELGAAVNIIDHYGKSGLSYALTDDTMAEIRTPVLAKFGANDAMSIMPNTDMPLWKYIYTSGNYEVLKFVFDKSENPLMLTDEKGKTVTDLVRENPDDVRLADLVSTYVGKKDNTAIREIVLARQTDLLRKAEISPEDLNAKDDQGETLLTMVIKNFERPDMDLLQVLLEKGADVNLENSAGQTALDICVLANQEECVAKLLEHGADVNHIVDDHTPLMNLGSSQIKITKLIIEHNPDITHITKNGETALMAAARNMNKALIEYLLSRDADVNAEDNEGNNALMYAARMRNMTRQPMSMFLQNMEDVMKLLIAAGIDVNKQGEGGETALMIVAQSNSEIYPEIRELLVSSGARENIKDQYGRTVADYLPADAKK